MLIKFSTLFSLILLTSYIPQASAMEPEDVELIDFIEVNNIIDDKKTGLIPAQKIMKINFAKRQKAPALNCDELFVVINNILETMDENEINQSAVEVNAKVLRLLTIKLPESRMLNYGNGILFHILYRGCHCEQLAMILVFGSAGGQAVNYQVGNPTEEEALEQVGESSRLPEFTNDKSVFTRFGTNSYCIAVKINNKYLTPGSRAENGFVALANAPVEVIGIMHGRRL